MKAQALKDSFHISGPTVLTGDNTAWRFDQSVTDGDFFDFGVQDFFHGLAQWLEFGFFLFEGFLLFLVFGEFEAFFGDANQVFTVVLFQLLSAVLVDWLGHVKNFESSFGKSFNKSGVFDGVLGFTSDVVDIVLVVLHSGNVVFQRGGLFRIGGVVSEEFSQLLPLVGVFVDTEFDVLTELFVEFIKGFLIFRNLVEKLDSLLDQVLSDNLQ